MSTHTREIGGHKAALKNPHVSEEAKVHSRQVIEELEADPETHEGGLSKHETRVNAGYKAALKNPNVSDEAKEHAQETLEERGAI